MENQILGSTIFENISKVKQGINQLSSALSKLEKGGTETVPYKVLERELENAKEYLTKLETTRYEIVSDFPNSSQSNPVHIKL